MTVSVERVCFLRCKQADPGVGDASPPPGALLVNLGPLVPASATGHTSAPGLGSLCFPRINHWLAGYGGEQNWAQPGLPTRACCGISSDLASALCPKCSPSSSCDQNK